MNKSKRNDYKLKILESLDDVPSGLTITEISDKTGAHRNTVSTHLRTLENEGLVSKKEIGPAHLYFSKRREYLSKVLVNSFLQALLSALKSRFPKKELIFKEIGNRILDKFKFPIGDAYIEEFKKARKSKDPITQLKLFEKFYNSYDFFQDDIDISIQELTKNKAVFRLTNSEYLKKTDEFVYFFYIVCGITERIYYDNLNREIKCDIDYIHLSDKKEESYVDISINFE